MRRSRTSHPTAAATVERRRNRSSSLAYEPPSGSTRTTRVQSRRAPEHASRDRREEDSNPFHLSDCRSAPEYVVVHPLDLVEHTQPTLTEQVEVNRKPSIHHAHQRQSLQ